jgi:hypothetical protein
MAAMPAPLRRSFTRTAAMLSLTLLSLTLLTIACPDDNDDPDVGDVGVNDVDVNDVPEVDVSNDADVSPQIDFAEVAQIIRLTCASGICHGQGGPGLNFQIPNQQAATDDAIRESIEGVMTSNAIPLVVPGEPEESALYQVLVTTDETRRMPPPPLELLSGEEIAIIRDWIAAGADYE